LEYTRRLNNEEKLTRMEKEGQAALEVAQEEDAPTEACPEDAQAVMLNHWGYGLIRYTRGLQLTGNDR